MTLNARTRTAAQARSARNPRTVIATTVLIALGMTIAGCAAPQRSQPALAPLKTDLPSGPTRADPKATVSVALQLATAYYQSRQYQTAMQALDKAHEIEPDNPRVLTLYGLILSELNDPVRARAALERAVKLAPGDTDASHNLATWLCTHQAPREGIEAFRRTLTLAGNMQIGNTYAALGQCQVRAGQEQLAAASFERALAYEAFNPAALYGLAEILLRRNQADAARPLAARLGRVMPASPETLWLSIRIERALGNQADLKMFAEDLRNQFPESPQARSLAMDRFE